MIGYINVRDIPKLIVGGTIGVLVLVGVGAALVSIPGFMDWLRRSPQWVGTGIGILLFVVSISFGQWCYGWIEDHFPEAQSAHVREVTELYRRTRMLTADERNAVYHESAERRMEALRTRMLTADEQNAVYRELAERRMEALSEAKKKGM